MMYNKTVQECFFSPRHVGSFDLNQPFTVVFKSKQQGQGAIEFYMQCSEDRRIERVCFKTNGNPYLIAGLEWLCRQLDGCVIDEVPNIDYQLIIKELDIRTAQYPLALRVEGVFKEVLVLMKKKYKS